MVPTTPITSENRSLPITNQLIYYLLPDLTVEKSNPNDDFSRLQQKLNKSIDLKTFLRERNKTLPALDTILPLRNISSQRPLITESTSWNVRSGSRTVSFQNLTINSTEGFVYIAISNENKTASWNNLPFSPYDFVTGNKSLIQSGLIDALVRFDLSTSQTFNIPNIASNRNFYAYFWATTENPSGLGNSTIVYKTAFKTTSAAGILKALSALIVSIFILGVLLI